MLFYYNILNMVKLTIGVLKQILENIPDDFTLEYKKNNKCQVKHTPDCVTIDCAKKRIIFDLLMD